jgi:hypothetical protein
MDRKNSQGWHADYLGRNSYWTTFTVWVPDQFNAPRRRGRSQHLDPDRIVNSFATTDLPTVCTPQDGAPDQAPCQIRAPDSTCNGVPSFQRRL